MRDVLLGTGVVELEVQAYRFLLKNGASTPTVVARETHQSRGRIYQVLRSLVEKSLAREEPTRPARYVAVPLRDLLVIMIAQATRRSSVLQTALAEDDRGLPSPALVVTQHVRSMDVSMMTGRRATFGEARRATIRAGRFLLVGGSGRACRRLAKSYALLGEIRAATSRGVQVELAVECPGDCERDYQLLAEELGAVRVTKLSGAQLPPFMIVATEHVAVLSLVQPDDDAIDAGTDLAVRIEGPHVASLVLALFAQFSAPPAPAHHASTAAGGLMEALGAAQVDVRVMGAHWWGGGNPDAGALRDAIRAVQARGVRVQAIVPRGHDGSPAELGAVQVDFAIPAMMVVDSSFLFQWYPPVARGNASVGLRLKSAPDEVQFWSEYFDAAWRLAGQPPASPTLAQPPETPREGLAPAPPADPRTITRANKKAPRP